jgi:hypothetical protein
MTIKNFIKLSALMLSFYSGFAYAEFNPPFSIEASKETFVVNADATFIHTMESSIKIETQRGVDSYGKRSVSYNKGTETIEIVEAYTLQPDGEKIKVSKEAIRTTDDGVNSGTAEFTETRHKTIIYPNVKIGSVLYFKIISKQQKPIFKGHFIFSEYFSPHFKYNRQTYAFEISDKLPVKFDSKGVTGGLVKTANHKNYYVYTFNQNTAEPMEDVEVDTDDFAPYIIASTFKDYIEFGKAYEKNAGNKIKVTPEIKDLADELTYNITDPKSQVEALYHWVSQNIRYVAIYLADGGVVPHSAETILKNQYGDCKDHTVLLAALLKAKGIASSPALINLGENYVLPKLPVFTPFNHVINYIPSLDMYLDATAQFAPFGTLPFEDMDKPVVLTSLEKLGRTPIAKPHENTVINDVFIRIKEDGSMIGDAHNAVTGYFNSDYRSLTSRNDGVNDLDRVTARLRNHGETGVGKIVTTNPSDLMKPFVENTQFHLDPKSNFPGPGAMAIPVGVVMTSIYSLASEKPIAQVKYPSICFSRNLLENYTLKFPRNVKIKRIPKNVNFEMAPFKYQATYQLKKDELKVRRMFESNHKSSVCGPNFAESRNAAFKVMQRDLRSQIFYD